MKKAASYKTLEAKRTDYDIPTFGFKSAFLIVFGGVVGSVVFPFLLSYLGVGKDLSMLIGNILFPSLAISYSRYFVESKKGICKEFWINYGIFALSFGIITYFWRYLGVFM
ncbi:hypothetical protein [Clostridium sp.]|uniref:hypothetical protein n=1 Tax=Clostridium sp. TaxID=1506 RepID=UPI00260FB609|nr:hypothetical protein [Clostridium sp.]